MTCNACGAVLDPGSLFCDSCGADNRKAETSANQMPVVPVAQAASVPERATRTCPFCGEQILQAAIKCRFCGSSLSAAATQAPAPGGITLNAPSNGPVPAGANYAAAPSIVIQNVQATQTPAAVPVHSGIYKNPAVALLLSFIFPGGGQFYNGHAGKGILVLLTFWIGGITYVWSLFDAYLSANRINRVGF